MLFLEWKEEILWKRGANMYKIGEFSKIVDIPIRTLRYYDEIGILQPNKIDNFSGYRYYSDENIVECETIKTLKLLDFTLDEILVYKNNLDEEIIEKKKKEIEERIYLLRLKHERLTLMQEKLKNKNKKLSLIEENEYEKVLRRKYEKRNVGKSA